MKSESDIKWHTVACLYEWIKARIQYGELFENGPPECGEPLSNTPNASTVGRNRSRCCTRVLLWTNFERSFKAECTAKVVKAQPTGLLVLLPRFWGGAFLLQPCKDAMVPFNRKGVVGFLHKRTSGARNKESEWRSEDRGSTVIHTANEHRTESSQSPSLCLQFTSSMQSDSVQDLHRSWETSKLRRCQNTSHITSQHESTWWSCQNFCRTHNTKLWEPREQALKNQVLSKELATQHVHKYGYSTNIVTRRHHSFKTGNTQYSHNTSTHVEEVSQNSHEESSRARQFYEEISWRDRLVKTNANAKGGEKGCQKEGTSSIEGFRRRKSKFENEHRDVKEMPEDWQKGHKKHTTKMTKDVKRKARDWKTTGVVSSIPSRAALPMRACSCTHSLSTIKHILSLPSQVFDFWSFPMFRPARPGTTCTKSARSLTAFITLQRGGSCKLIPQSPGAEANWAVSRCILRFNVLHLHWFIHGRRLMVEELRFKIFCICLQVWLAISQGCSSGSNIST